MSYLSRISVILLIAYGGAAVLAHTWRPHAAPHYTGIDPGMIPASIAPYDVSQDFDIGANTRNMLSTGDIFARRYAVKSTDYSIDFVLIGGQDRNSMHDPRLCLTGSGDKLTGDRIVRLTRTNVEARAYRATDKKGVAYDVLYFYVTNGRIDNEYARVRQSMLWCDLTGQVKPPVYFLRFTQLAPPDPATDSASFDRLIDFAASMWVKLRPRLAKAPGA